MNGWWERKTKGQMEESPHTVCFKAGVGVGTWIRIKMSSMLVT